MLGIRATKGFTLSELIIMLVVVAILALIAIPSLTSTVKKHRLIVTSESLFNTLQYAKSEAIKRNANVYVSFVTGDNWCYGVNVGSSCTCSTAGSCGLGSVSAPATQQLSLSTSGLTNNSVYFEGTHSAANASGSVTFTLYGQSTLITIAIGRLGGLQFCATGVGGYTGC